MTKFVEAVEGYKAHWEVSEPAMTQLLTEQFQDRSGLFVSVVAIPGTMPAQELFHQGEPVVVLLPIGVWTIEFSSNGSDWRMISSVTSEHLGLRLNYILDGHTFPRRWARYSKLT